MSLVGLLDMYNRYGYTSNNLPDAGVAGAVGAIFAGLGVLLLFIVAAVVVCAIANWKLFTKMDMEGWKSLIPGVNQYLQMEKTGVNHLWLLIVTYGAVLSIVPVLGYLVFLAAIIYYTILCNVSLANSFGKSTGFAVGLILCPFVFLPILAFSDSKYIGKKPMNDVIFKNTAKK